MNADRWGIGRSAARNPEDAGGDGDGTAAGQSADVGRMVAAVGGVLGWRGAVHLELQPGQQRMTAAGRWRGVEAEELPGPPTWVGHIDPASWSRRRVVWRPAARQTGRPEDAAVAVPIFADGAVTGVLAFFGPELGEPDDAATALLEAVAGLLGGGRGGRAARATADPAPGGDTWQRAIALVDVFAFTVLVIDTGRFEWRYFGPNSRAVFGHPVTAEESLASLVRRHACREDLPAVEEFERAASQGRPLEIEFRVVGLDGVTRWVAWRTVPRRTDGRLHVDGVATDVTARRSLGRTRRDLVDAHARYAKQVDTMQAHTLAVRDANDNVLQRIFAAGLRLQMLKGRLQEADAHAASTIAFQLDEAATELREIIMDLNEMLKAPPPQGVAEH